MQLATLCYIKKDNKTLMLYRNKKKNDVHQGKWNGLGGKFEKGETPEECAIREIKEESGLDVKSLKLKGHILFPNFSHNKDWYVYFFVIDKFTGTLIDSPEGELEWIEDSKLLNLNLWDGDKIFLKWLEQDKFFSAKFVYKNSKFLDYTVNFY